MDIKKIISESISKNPTGLNQAFENAIMERIALALEKKKLDKVDPEQLKGDFEDREDKDIDNDGDVDDSDEYLHNRRKAIMKAMKKESVNLDEAPERVVSKKGNYTFVNNNEDETVHVKLKGKTIASGQFDLGADGWFFTVKGQRGQKFFREPEDAINFFMKESVNLDEKVNTGPEEAISIIANSIAMKPAIVKAALEAAKLDPIAVVTALKGKKSINAMQLGNLIMGHSFGGSIDRKDLMPIKKAADTAFIGKMKEEVDLDEAIDHSRYMRSHGKKARGRGTWMFTTKDMGEPSGDEMVTVSGDLSTAAKEAAKKLGTKIVYVMENVELDEDVHNDLNDAIIDFQKKLMKMTRQLDPAIVKEIKKIDKDLDDLRTGSLFKIRPGR